METQPARCWRRQTYKIVFKKSAGITNPAVAGARYAIKVDDLDPGTHTYTFDKDRSRARSRLKASGPRGTQVEVSAVGLRGGDATFYLQRQNYDWMRAPTYPRQETATTSFWATDTAWTRPLPQAERPR